MKRRRGRVGLGGSHGEARKGLAGQIYPPIMAYYGIGVGRCPPPTADSEEKGEQSL